MNISIIGRGGHGSVFGRTEKSFGFGFGFGKPYRTEVNRFGPKPKKSN